MDEAVDGRRLRRERGRRRVVDAMIDLVLEHGTPPSADRITERSGVSQASLFRYFGTLEELRREGISRYFERFDDLIAIPAIGDGDLSDRIERFVAARDAFYGQTAPMGRLVRRQAGDVPALAETVERVRRSFADQVAQHFASELDVLDPTTRRRRIAALAAATSFETWEQLATLGPASRRTALAESVAALLAGHH